MLEKNSVRRDEQASRDCSGMLQLYVRNDQLFMLSHSEEQIEEDERQQIKTRQHLKRHILRRCGEKRGSEGKSWMKMCSSCTETLQLWPLSSPLSCFSGWLFWVFCVMQSHSDILIFTHQHKTSQMSQLSIFPLCLHFTHYSHCLLVLVISLKPPPNISTMVIF